MESAKAGRHWPASAVGGQPGGQVGWALKVEQGVGQGFQLLQRQRLDLGGGGVGQAKSLENTLKESVQAVRKFGRCMEGSCWRSSQRQPLQAFKPREIAIEAHQAPAIGDRQGCQIGIGAQTGRHAQQSPCSHPAAGKTRPAERMLLLPF